MNALLQAWTATAHSPGEVELISVAVKALQSELHARDREIANLKRRVVKLEAR